VSYYTYDKNQGDDFLKKNIGTEIWVSQGLQIGLMLYLDLQMDYKRIKVQRESAQEVQENEFRYIYVYIYIYQVAKPYFVYTYLYEYLFY